VKKDRIAGEMEDRSNGPSRRRPPPGAQRSANQGDAEADPREGFEGVEEDGWDPRDAPDEGASEVDSSSVSGIEGHSRRAR